MPLRQILQWVRKKTESELTKNFPGRRTGTEKKGNARNGATKGNVMGTQ